MGWDGIHNTVRTKLNIFSGPKRNYNEQEVWVKVPLLYRTDSRPKLTYQYQHDPDDKEIIITTMVMMIITTQTGLKIITTLTDDHDHYYHPDHA